MNDPSSKTFDCVQSTRQIRDRLSAEMADMSYDQLVQWLREPNYKNSFLRQLAERAAQQADAAERMRAAYSSGIPLA